MIERIRVLTCRNPRVHIPPSWVGGDGNDRGQIWFRLASVVVSLPSGELAARPRRGWWLWILMQVPCHIDVIRVCIIIPIARNKG